MLSGPAALPLFSRRNMFLTVSVSMVNGGDRSGGGVGQMSVKGFSNLNAMFFLLRTSIRSLENQGLLLPYALTDLVRM